MLQRYTACLQRRSSVCVQARGFGRKRDASRKKSPPITTNEAKKLVGEYSAVKQPPVTSNSRAPPTDRTQRAAEASAAAPAAPAAPDHANTAKHVAPPAAKGQSGSLAGKAASNAPSSTTDSSSSSGGAAKVIQAKSTPAAGSTGGPATLPGSSDSSGSAGSNSGSTPAPTASSSPSPAPIAPLLAAAASPPLPSGFKAAGTRHTGFESKLTSKPDSQPDAAAGTASSLARLTAAHDDLAAAEQHVQGLATLLQEAQATLESLRNEPVDGADAAAAAAHAAAEQLVGLMSDVLSDITGEMELVCGQLVAARTDVGESKQQIETAMAAAAPAAAGRDTAVAAVEAEAAAAVAAAEARAAAAEAQAAEAKAAAAAAAKAQAAAEAKAAEAAAAMAAAAAAQATAAEAQAVAEAATKECASLKSQVEMRSAELAVAVKNTSQLQAQLSLLMPSAIAESGSIEGAPETDPRVRALLVSQVASNMAMLDWLSCLARTVIGLEGVSPQDRVKLATTISKCVLAVGGGSNSSPASDSSGAPGQE